MLRGLRITDYGLGVIRRITDYGLQIRDDQGNTDYGLRIRDDQTDYGLRNTD